MDQDIVIDALQAHLDVIGSLVNAIILLAVVIGWAGIRREKQIEALSLKIDRPYAFYAMATIYLLANMTILILFLRIGDLFTLLDATHFTKGLSKVVLHSWVLNPFGYFGMSSIARVHSGEGFGLLIAVWWLCNTSLYTLLDFKTHKIARILLGVFLCIGLASMIAIERIFDVVLQRLKIENPELFGQVITVWPERIFGTILGIVIGALIFWAAIRLQNRWL